MRWNLKKIKYLKRLVIVILLVLSYIFLNNLIQDLLQRPVKMVLEKSFWNDSEIVSSRIYSNSLVTWDSSKLRFHDFQGNKIDEIIGNGYFTNIYYYKEDIALLDKQLNVLYLYSPTGELKKKIDLNGPIFTVYRNNGDFYTQKKTKDSEFSNEEIYKYEGEEREAIIIQTPRFITDFRVDGGSYYISELSSDNYLYKASLSILNKKKEEKYDFDNETILDILPLGSKTIAITNKNLYSLKNNEKEKVEIDNFRNYIFDENSVGILTNNQLIFYDYNLKEKERIDIDITPTGVFKHMGGYFVYGPTDMVGFLGQGREFKKSFESLVYGITSNENALLVQYKYSTELYSFKEISKSEDN